MRSKKTPHRIIVPDARYSSTSVAKMITGCMQAGRKNVSTSIVYDALAHLKEKTKANELNYLEEAIENIKPQMEVRSRRVGGASYQVPTPVRPERKQTVAIRWLIAAARERSNSQYHSFAEKLTAEIMDAHENAGNAIKKKLETHRMADANKAFSHLRW